MKFAIRRLGFALLTAPLALCMYAGSFTLLSLLVGEGRGIETAMPSAIASVGIAYVLMFTAWPWLSKQIDRLINH